MDNHGARPHTPYLKIGKFKFFSFYRLFAHQMILQENYFRYHLVSFSTNEVLFGVQYL